MKMSQSSRRTEAFLAVGVIGIVSLVWGGAAVSAQDASTQTTITDSRVQEARQKAEAAQAEAKARAAEAKARAEAKVAEAKQRLEGKKLELCKAREQRIAATMTQMSSRGDNHLAVFTKIADRVEAFYKDKGRTVANYDALVAEVDAKRQAAETAIESTKSVDGVFSCDSDNPKIASEQFRDAFKAQVAALKDYRTAIKNLIVAVKSAQSTEAQATKTEEPTNE